MNCRELFNVLFLPTIKVPSASVASENAAMLFFCEVVCL